MNHDAIYCAKCRRSWPRRLWYVAIEKVMRVDGNGNPDGEAPQERVLRCRTCRQFTAVPVEGVT